jgi:hypothetical protein
VLVGRFGRVRPADRDHGGHDLGARLVVGDAGEHVDDRLREQSGDRRTADVFDGPDEPRAQHPGEPVAFALEQ